MSAQEQKIKEVFEQVWELAPGERERALNELCAGDERLRGEVTNLLQSHAEAGAFLDDRFTNHSDDPNMRADGDFTYVAARDIQAGEEITCDYWALGGADSYDRER
ncbi:MAG: SET domain-containing protein-lysine N-methyltransferase [Blastocatellales bacterium]